jgi:hypothetical protein
MATEVDPIVLPADWEPYVLGFFPETPPPDIAPHLAAWRAYRDPVTRRVNGTLRLYAVLRRFDGPNGEKLIEFAAEAED